MSGASLTATASTLASLLAILFALAGAVWLAKRLRGRLPGGGAHASAAISIISSRPLGGMHSLIIAEADGQRFLIGLSRGQITTIGRLNRND